jgi:hypothetical protein
VFFVQHIAVLISNWSDFEVMMLEKFGKDLTPHHGPERDMDRDPVFSVSRWQGRRALGGCGSIFLVHPAGHQPANGWVNAAMWIRWF